MYERRILRKLALFELWDIAKYINKFFPLVTDERIFELILQTDSIDIALHLLLIHRDEELTSLDAILFDFLRGQDEK